MKFPASLAEAPLHQPLRVVSIGGEDQGRLARLSGLGIVPGSILWVRQRRPAFVLQSDETWLALEGAIARLVQVTLVDAPPSS